MTIQADATQDNASKSGITPLVAGNWKMNGQRSSITEVMAIRDAILEAQNKPKTDVMICPPATLLMVLAELIDNSVVAFGGQDCHILEKGAHTGDISAAMLKDAGASAIIVGHSERRENHSETDDIVLQKAQAVHNQGLMAIVCIGETKGQRQAGLTIEVVSRQLAASVPEGATAKNTVIAYEPVWAIGTGLVPTLEDVANVHKAIRKALCERFPAQGANMRILYGGSVNPTNAQDLMSVENVNGALVGGASLKATDFLQIIDVYAPSD